MAQKMEWNIVAKTLTAIRKWAYYQTPEDLAEKIVGSPLQNQSDKGAPTPTKKKSNKDKVAEWTQLIYSFEQGKAKPIGKQLEKIAEHCYKPLAAFLLPVQNICLPKRPRDFRKDTTSIIDIMSECHPFIFQTLAKQNWASNLIAQNNPNYSASFLNFPKKDTSDHYNLLSQATMLVEKISKDFDIDLNKWRSASENDQITQLEDAIAKKNILLFSPNSNYTNQKFSIDTLKGFAIYDRHAPLIAINDYDFNINPKKRGGATKIFTLLHELAHLYIFQEEEEEKRGVVSFGFSQEDEWNDKVGDRERFCNMVAEEFIMPAETFGKLWQKTASRLSNETDNSTNAAHEICQRLKQMVRLLTEQAKKLHSGRGRFAKPCVSKWVMLYRARNLGYLNQGGKFSEQKRPDDRAIRLFRECRKIFLKETQDWIEKEKQLALKKKEDSNEAEEEVQAEEVETNDEQDGKEQGKTAIKKEERKTAINKAIKTNGVTFCKLAMSAHMASKMSSENLKEVLGITHLNNIQQLSQEISNS